MIREIIASVVFTLAALCGSAQAAIVYNNGAPNAVDGNETTQWIQAEDFNIAAGAVINHATVYLAGFGGIGAWDGTLNYFIFDSAGTQPGSLLASGSALNLIATDTGNPWCCGGNAFAFDFDINPFAAAAGTTYWFGIHASSNFDRDQIYWVTTDPTFGNGNESFQGTMGNWISNGQEHAFSLSSNDVPEPGTTALIAVGLLAGLALRRKA